MNELRALLWMILLSVGMPSPLAWADLLDVDQIEKDAPEEKPVPEEVKPKAPEPQSKEKASASGKGEKKPASKAGEGKPKSKGVATTREPIRLKSDGKSTYSKNADGIPLIHLEKNVVITQADVRFQADEAKVYMLPEQQTDDGVDRVEVIGNVQMSKFSEDPNEKLTAKGDKAFFYNDKQKVTLVGNARLWRGGHLIKGRQITYDLPSGLITVDKAEGVVQPGEGKK